MQHIIQFYQKHKVSTITNTIQDFNHSLPVSIDSNNILNGAKIIILCMIKIHLKFLFPILSSPVFFREILWLLLSLSIPTNKFQLQIYIKRKWLTCKAFCSFQCLLLLSKKIPLLLNWLPHSVNGTSKSLVKKQDLKWWKGCTSICYCKILSYDHKQLLLFSSWCLIAFTRIVKVERMNISCGMRNSGAELEI